MRVDPVRLLGLPVCLALICLTGCAVYHPAPLPSAPDLAAVPSLTVPASQFWLPGMAPRPFPTNGLDQTSVITLAVFDNPDLKAARLQAGVAHAQLVQAGLLPNPQLNADFAKSALNYGGDIGLSEDLQALITRGAAKAAAKANERAVNLNILWQEWEVAQTARDLFIQIRSDELLRGVLISTHEFLAKRYREDNTAMQKGDLTLSAVTADLTLLTNSEAKLRQLEVDENTTVHQLNSLLGLTPDARLHLIGSTSAGLLSKSQLDEAIAALPHRRADLLALQAGYEAQERHVREAVVAQFPNISAGVVFSRDPVEGVNDLGPEVSLSLPLFNRNQGQIALERATRSELRQTYQARLDQAAGQADQVWQATQIMDRQLSQLDMRLTTLRNTESAAKKSFEEGNLSAALYVQTELSLLSAEADDIQLRAARDRAESVLDTLLGVPFNAS
jgi:cobalt-zinc-cadmium efflux system outer membrane protein